MSESDESVLKVIERGIAPHIQSNFYT